jgi:DedD protein
MNDILKQRLVGALILVALAVVFWPIIFVEPGDVSRDERAGIPPRPAVDTRPVASPDMVGLRPSPEIEAHQDPPEPEPAPRPEPGPSESTAGEPAADGMEPSPAAVANEAPALRSGQEAARTRSEAPERPTMDADGLPVAWILQVASVSSVEKADELRQRLVALEHKAYVKRIKHGDKTLYRVYVGPKFERARLERIQGQIDKEFGVQSMIARYVP